MLSKFYASSNQNLFDKFENILKLNLTNKKKREVNVSSTTNVASC
jgi:hypothetical protein